MTSIQRFPCVLIAAVVGLATSAAADESKWAVVESSAVAGLDAKTAELKVEIVGGKAGEKGQPLPARVIITGSDGKHIDGSGRGVYQDGRFFVDGALSARAPAGKTRVQIWSGPEHVPLDVTVDLTGGSALQCRAELHRWFDAASRGWHGGDNHVHTQHDATVAIRTDPAYTALQARANGLNFITEADHERTTDALKVHDTATFLYRQAPELRPGPFVGHFNTPGIRAAIERERYQQIVAQPLPALAIHREVRGLGGVMIRTHPMSPPYQLHWMGAAETWSDAALGEAGDLLDVDSPATELLWFTALNLGNRIGVSSYTDCALGRRNTMSPGDRRVYAKADKLDYAAVVESMRRGRTIATNGGPLFTFLTAGDKGIGDICTAKAGDRIRLRCEVHSLRPLRSVELYHKGGRLHAFKLDKRQGGQVLEHEVTVSGEDWFVLRADDERNAWSITSPIYVGDAEKRAAGSPAAAMIFEISNHTRFIQLRRDFFAHIVATVRPPEEIAVVRLLHEGKLLREWTPVQGDQRDDDRAPVTDIRGDYGQGWQWHRINEQPVHFQADWPVKESGWYTIEIDTSRKRTLRSCALRFRADHPVSHALSFASLTAERTSLMLRGYGEEQALRDIRSPFVGDGWWYPKNTAWQVKATFGEWAKEVGGNVERLDGLVRLSQ